MAFIAINRAIVRTIMTIAGIVIAVVAGNIIGMLWFSKRAFGASWARMNGIDKVSHDEKIAAMRRGLTVGTIALIVMVSMLAILFSLANINTIPQGLFTSAYLWLGFVAPTFAMNYVYAGKSLRLYLIDALYYLLVMLAVGMILAVTV